MNSTGRHDGGFTLIEASIALLIASFIFLGLAQTISSALRASEQRRLEQQAVALISEVVEDVRNLTFDEVALLPATSDPSRTPATTYDPGTGAEPIIESATAALPAQVTTEAFNAVTYTLTRYVTWVDDNPSDSVTKDYKRMTVVAEWDTRGQTRTEIRETLVASRDSRDASTGNYGVSIDPTVDSQTAAVNSTVTFTHTIENTGSMTETFELVVINDLGWPVSMVRADTGSPPVTTNGIPTPDTGSLDPGDTLDIEVSVHVPLGTAASEASETTVVASSAVKPSVAASAVDKVKSTGGTGSPVLLALHLRRSSILSPAAPLGGHAELSGPNGTTWFWNWTVPTDLTFTTDAQVHLYVKRRGTCASADVEYRATLIGSISGIFDSAGSGNINVDCTPVAGDVVLSVSGDDLAGGETLRLAVEVLKVSGGNADKSGLTLAYDGFDFDSYVRFEVAP